MIYGSEQFRFAVKLEICVPFCSSCLVWIKAYYDVARRAGYIE